MVVVLGSPARSALRCCALLALPVLGALGCRADLCARRAPAAQVTITLPQGADGSQVTVLDVVLTGPSGTASEELVVHGELDDGVTSFVVDLGDLDEDGGDTTPMELTAKVSAMIGDDPLAVGEATFTTTGDACNFFELPLSGDRPGGLSYVAGGAAKIDLLVVVDNSTTTMELPQALLAQQIGHLLETLEGALTEATLSLRIGVVSTDVGTAGGNPQTNCVGDGDNGELQHAPQVPGCQPPTDDWIGYVDGQTNIPDGPADAVERVAAALSCIAQLGHDGCGFEGPLEAARRAVDPALDVNPGFPRDDALLALLLLTDEDDCSVKNPQLFQPENSTLGPLTSFRCFEFGIRCDTPPEDPRAEGPRSGCQPALDWLHPVEDYVAFFAALAAPRGGLAVAALAGPTAPVSVGRSSGKPKLDDSCVSSTAMAAPAIRLASFVEAFDGHFASICSGDYRPALAALGQRIARLRGSACVTAPLLTAGGALVCLEGATPGEGKPCAKSCLAAADCALVAITDEGTGGEQRQAVERCPARYFAVGSGGVPEVQSCEDDCAALAGGRCWRLVPSTACGSGPPMAFEVLRSQSPSAPTKIVATCHETVAPWSTVGALRLPQCD